MAFQEKDSKFYIMMALMVITGTLNTIFLNLQNKAYDTILNAKFNHPWFQTILMFIGEFYCAILWAFKKKAIRAEEEQKLIDNPKNTYLSLPEPPVWVFLISCMCDLVGSTLLNFALLNMAGSVFQMLRGGIIVVTCVFMIIFLKKYPRNFEWLGVGIVFIGVFLVGLASQLKKDDGNTVETNILGIIMLLISLLFQGFQFIYQEKILIKYRTHPMQLVAWEGT
jgi:drug/metabolite transporter (DMT)-like permease